MDYKKVTGSSKIISWAVFVFALFVIGLHLISVIFPSIILESILAVEVKNNPFELGAWGIPIIISNVSILVLGILFYTKKIPKIIPRLFQFVLKFEISKNVALILGIILIFVYIGSVIPELGENEGLTWGDFGRVKSTVDSWPEQEENSIKSLWILHVKNFLVKSSVVIFDNYRIVPFLATVSLLILTYFFTFEITKKRLSGIIAMVVLTQSNIFLIFDTLATYANFWNVFYLASLYLIIKKWSLSPIAYVASIFSKPLSAAFFPMTIFFIFRAEISRRKKIYVLISYVALAIIVAFGLLFLQLDVGGGIISEGLTFSYIDFWSGFTSWALQMRFEGWFLLHI